MTTDLDTIILANITAQLDDLTRSLADVPGRAPQDKQVAYALMAVAIANVNNAPGVMARERLEQLDIDKAEAEAIASALEALALRLGAWLGRDR